MSLIEGDALFYPLFSSSDIPIDFNVHNIQDSPRFQQIKKLSTDLAALQTVPSNIPPISSNENSNLFSLLMSGGIDKLELPLNATLLKGLQMTDDILFQSGLINNPNKQPHQQMQHLSSDINSQGMGMDRQLYPLNFYNYFLADYYSFLIMWFFLNIPLIFSQSCWHCFRYFDCSRLCDGPSRYVRITISLLFCFFRSFLPLSVPPTLLSLPLKSFFHSFLISSYSSACRCRIRWTTEGQCQQEEEAHRVSNTSQEFPAAHLIADGRSGSQSRRGA